MSSPLQSRSLIHWIAADAYGVVNNADCCTQTLDHPETLCSRIPTEPANATAAGPHMSADESGRCICSDPSPFACATQLLGLLCAAVVAITAAVGYFCFLGGKALSKGGDRLSTQLQALRKRLGLRKRDGYILSSERIPLWHSQSMFTIIPAEHFDAAVRLDCLLNDFDPKHIDAFCLALHDMPCSVRIGEWILDLCRFLLDPAVSSKPSSDQRRRGRGSASSIWLSSAFSNQNGNGDDSGKNMDPCLLSQLQENRLAYFHQHIAGLHIFLMDNKALFKRLKGVVDDLMVQVGGQCMQRFLRLVSEEGGECLTTLKTLAEWRGTASVSKSILASGSYSVLDEINEEWTSQKQLGCMSPPTLALEHSM
jgi:hypothetical protein